MKFVFVLAVVPLVAFAQDEVCDRIREFYGGQFRGQVHDCIELNGVAFYRNDEYSSWNFHQSRCNAFDANSNLASIRNFRELFAVRLLTPVEGTRFGGTGSSNSLARKWIGIYSCGFLRECWVDGGRPDSFSRAKHGYWSRANRCGYSQIYQQERNSRDQFYGFHEDWRTTRHCAERYQGICKYTFSNE